MLNLLRNNNQYGNFIIPFQPVLMLFVGIMTLVLRNPDPIFNPIMLLEDGYWTGLGITNGWMYTFINAKDGYFVWINLLLLLFAERSSAVFCNNSLICLPQAIALLS